MTLILHGYKYSVYQRIVRMVLAEKQATYRQVEVDPFGDLPPGYLNLHPFERVPVLVDGDFTLFETAAITRYIDETIAPVTLQPDDPRARARMAQIIAIVDAYGYRPMVRQVFAQAVFNPRLGQEPNRAMIEEGLAAASTVLNALEAIAAQGLQLDGRTVSLADCHLAPILGYFTQVEEGRRMVEKRRHLDGWWQVIRERPSFLATDPGLSK